MRHKWHVHMKPFSDDVTSEAGRCASMSGHFNPYHVTKKVGVLINLFTAKGEFDETKKTPEPSNETVVAWVQV